MYCLSVFCSVVELKRDLHVARIELGEALASSTHQRIRAEAAEATAAAAAEEALADKERTAADNELMVQKVGRRHPT